MTAVLFGFGSVFSVYFDGMVKLIAQVPLT